MTSTPVLEDDPALWRESIARLPLSQPALIDLPDDRVGTTPAALEMTKRGQMFLLDRETGGPLAEVAEKAECGLGDSSEHARPQAGALFSRGWSAYRLTGGEVTPP